MPAPPPVEVSAVLAAIDSLHGTVAMARALVESGRAVDLAGLDGEAARLCAAVACLAGDAGSELRAPMILLREEVDRLIGALATA